MRKRLPEIFRTLPESPFEIVRVPPEIEDGAPNGYARGASLDGKRPSRYYINLKDTSDWPKFSLPTLTYHEALPGHVWQGSIARESTHIPLIRRVGLGFAAYGEGWALYAEQLADELCVYESDLPLGASATCNRFYFAPCAWSSIPECMPSAGRASRRPTTWWRQRRLRAREYSGRSTVIRLAGAGLQLLHWPRRVDTFARGGPAAHGHALRHQGVPRCTAAGPDAARSARTGGARHALHVSALFTSGASFTSCRVRPRPKRAPKRSGETFVGVTCSGAGLVPAQPRRATRLFPGVG